ncbi:MAG: hypothetical protein M0R33_13805 [Methylomonas sp.]|jgi:hypothetical protein|uniref:hypothetical protein n=1 Tax=Methylomonas sp. TaxID=418 RepID=UPI0025E76E1F|nr:hypothetical protein [Methylomonas sp.]MCK9607510.1 hypothetical protein [Methylomonas sp.]
MDFVPSACLYPIFEAVLTKQYGIRDLFRWCRVSHDWNDMVRDFLRGHFSSFLEKCVDEEEYDSFYGKEEAKRRLRKIKLPTLLPSPLNTTLIMQKVFRSDIIPHVIYNAYGWDYRTGCAILKEIISQPEYITAKWSYNNKQLNESFARFFDGHILLCFYDESAVHSVFGDCIEKYLPLLAGAYCGTYHTPFGNYHALVRVILHFINIPSCANIIADFCDWKMRTFLSFLSDILKDSAQCGVSVSTANFQAFTNIELLIEQSAKSTIPQA